MSLAQLYVVLRLNSDPFQRGMAGVMNQIGALQRGFGGLGGTSLSNVGRALTLGLTVPLIAAGAIIGNVGSQLTSEMSRVQSVIASPGNPRNGLIAGWTNDVQALGVALGRTSPEVTQGLYEITSAFGALPNTMEFLTIAGRAAVAGQSDIATSTRNLALMTRAWGDSSTQAVQRMADLGSATVRVGTLTEQEMGGAMSGLLPIMKLYNVGLNEGFAGLASLAGVSGTASQASTQLQRAITSIVAPNTALTKAYKQLGITSGEALIAQKGLLGAFDTIRQISEATGVPLQKLMGRIEGVKAVATLTGPQLQAFNDNLKVMEQSAGDVDRAFLGFTEGIGATQFKWAQAVQRMRVIAEDLYIALAPAALNVADSLAPIGAGLAVMAEAVGAMDTGKLTIIVGALLGLAALGPVLTVIGGLVQLFGALRVVAVALSGPVGLVAAAFAALWLAYDQNWFGVKDKIAGAWEWILQNAPNVTRELDQLNAAVKEVFNPPLPEGPGDQVPGLFQRYGQAQKEFFDVLKGVWQTIGDQSAQFQARIQATITNLKAMWDSLSSGISAVVQGIIRSFLGLSLGAAAMVLGIGAAFTGLGALFSGAVQSVGQLVSGMKTGFANAITAAKGAVTGIINAFKISWSSIGSSIASGIAGGISSGVAAIKSAAVGAATAALNAAKSALGIHSPSAVFRDQVGAMIPAGLALGIYDNARRVQQAIDDLIPSGGSRYGVNLEGRAMQMGVAMAGAGGGSTTTNETTINVYVTAAPGATHEDGQAVGAGITEALRRRGLA